MVETSKGRVNGENGIICSTTEFQHNRRATASFRKRASPYLPPSPDVIIFDFSDCGIMYRLADSVVCKSCKEDHIKTLALSLSELEEFYTSGGEVSSDVLLALSQLKKLKSLTLLALTQFDTVSILDFLGRLDSSSQQGFHLSLMAVDTLYALSDEEAELIREFIHTNLNGRFEWEPWRTDDVNYSDDD